MATNPFGDVGGFIADKIFSGILWFGIAVIVIIAISGVFYYLYYYRRKFDILAKIKSERAGDTKIYYDKAAIFYDKKDRTSYLRLLDGKIDLPIPPFNIIQKTIWPRGTKDMVELLRVGEKTYIYLLPAKIVKSKVVRQDGKVYTIGETDQMMVEGDVDYWNTLRKQKNKSLFGTDSLLMKILPWIPHIITGVFIIFILYIFMDSLPGILSELKGLVTEMKTLKGAEVTTYG